MYHPSMWHPIDMAAALRSIRQTASALSPNTSPEKNPVSGFNAAFSVNTLLNQSSPDQIRFPSMATAAHQHHLFSSLFQHYPYAPAFRPLFNGTTNSSSDSSAFLPAGKRFKNDTHDENHCETTSSKDESFGKHTGMKTNWIQTLVLCLTFEENNIRSKKIKIVMKTFSHEST